MSKFNKDIIMQPNTVVHTETKEQDRKLREWANGEGLKASNGKSLLNATFRYEQHGNQTCHNLYKGTYSNKDYFRIEGSKILSYEDILIKKPKKERPRYRTFKSAIQLAKFLAKGHRARVNKRNYDWCSYNTEEVVPFRIGNIVLTQTWKYADGITEWEVKYKNKKEINPDNEIKRAYSIDFSYGKEVERFFKESSHE